MAQKEAKITQKNEVISELMEENVLAKKASASTSSARCSTATADTRVHWEIRETMKEPEVETIVQRALEKNPGQKPRTISDNGPQFIAKDFKQFIRLAGITHVRTSPYYPQSNGKLEAARAQ